MDGGAEVLKVDLTFLLNENYGENECSQIEVAEGLA